MNLAPIVVLVDPDDLTILQPIIDDLVAQLDTRADMIRDLLATRGWTAEMIAWSSVVHAIADAIRTDAIQLQITTREDPTT